MPEKVAVAPTGTRAELAYLVAKLGALLPVIHPPSGRGAPWSAAAFATMR